MSAMIRCEPRMRLVPANHASRKTGEPKGNPSGKSQSVLQFPVKSHRGKPLIQRLLPRCATASPRFATNFFAQAIGIKVPTPSAFEAKNTAPIRTNARVCCHSQIMVLDSTLLNLLQRLRRGVSAVQNSLHLVTAFGQQLDQAPVKSQALREIQRHSEVVDDRLCHPFSFAASVRAGHKSRPL